MRVLCKFLMALFIVAFSFVPAASAEVVTVEAEGEYTMGDGAKENPITAKEIARKNALRSAAEQVAVYVESFSAAQNFNLTSDQIFTISAAVMKVLEEDFEYQTISQKAIKVVYFIKAEVDSSNIDLKELLKDRKTLNKNSQLEEQVKSQQEEIKRLKKKIDKLNATKTTSKNNEIISTTRFTKFTIDNYTYYVDEQNVLLKKIPNSTNEYMLDVWVRMVDNQDSKLQDRKYFLEHYYLRPKTNQIQFLGESEVVGNKADKFFERGYDDRNWENVIPRSIESIIYYTIMEEFGKKFF